MKPSPSTTAKPPPRPLTWAGVCTFSPAVVGSLAWAWLGDWQWGITGLGLGVIAGMAMSVVERRHEAP